MSEFIGGLLALLTVLLFVAAVVCLFRPIRQIGMGSRKRALGGIALSFVLMIISGSLLPAAEESAPGVASQANTEASPEKAASTEATTAQFGETRNERNAREAVEGEAAITDHWVRSDVATEHSSPGGAIVNRVYYGQQLRAYEKRGDWYRTTQDGFEPRWTRASQLAETRPPERAAAPVPTQYQDDRIAADAIPNPGEDGLTRADVEIMQKGAKLVLQTRPDCSRIVGGDKSVSRANTYYVTCVIGGQWNNVFFTRAEVQRATLR